MDLVISDSTDLPLVLKMKLEINLPHFKATPTFVAINGGSNAAPGLLGNQAIATLTGLGWTITTN